VHLARSAKNDDARFQDAPFITCALEESAADRHYEVPVRMGVPRQDEAAWIPHARDHQRE
jgi:hypothetical protein